MITLFIDTSNNDVSISVVKNGVVLNTITNSVLFQHSIYTVPYIKEVLDNCSLSCKDINNILVVNGPGSFTGVRIGLTIAKVFAYLCDIDIRTVSSLKTLALSCNSSYILSVVDAKHDNYYIGLYDCNYNIIVDEHFGNKSEVLDIISKYSPKVISCSDISIDDITINKVDLDIANIVSFCLKDDACNVHMVVPNYLKLPQVMENNND